MALDKLTKIDGGGISTTSNYRVGIITATKFVGPIEGTITSADATFTGNVSIAGTLTYEDVTNVDSVGVITARNGIKVSTGTATTALVVDGDARVTGILTVGTSSLKLDGPNNLVNVGTALTLGHSQGVQFHTQNLHSAGFEVNQINASGIITATGADINGDLDVDGHTNLDNVSIAGVTTTNTLHVAANNTTVGVAITQSGSGDILKLYDGTSEVFTVANQDDGIGAVTISSPKPRIVFNETNATPDYQIRMNGGIFSIHDSTNNIGRISITSSRTDINNPVLLNNDTVWIGDKLVHWTDDDTAIRFPTADTITAETGGSERLRINSDRVIIGQSLSNNQPTYNSSTTFVTTHTNNPGAWNAIAIISGNSTGASFVKFGDKDDEDVSQIGHYNADNSLRFYTNGGGATERLRIDSNGDVGINETNPTQKLHVGGSIKLTAQLMQSMPADYWSQSNTFIELNGIGNLTHMGGFETNLTSNGYRDTNGQWVSYAANSEDGAAQIGLKPQGSIVFRTDASKANGTAHNPSTRLTIDDEGVRPQGGVLNLKNSSSTGNVTVNVLGVSGDSRIDLENTGNGNYSGIDFVRERSSGTGIVGGSIFMKSDTSSNDAFLYLQAQSASAQSPVTTALSDGNGVRLILKGGDGIFSVEAGASEKLRIDSTGGLTSSGTGAKFNLTNSGTNATEQTATFLTSNSGTHNRIVIKTSTNNGGDPYIKFDAGGQDMIVGTRYAGTTNNLLVLGPGLDPDTTSGIFVKGNGNIGINETSPDARLHISSPASTTCEIRLTANNTGSGSGDRGRINVYSSRNDGTEYQAGYVDIDRSSGTEDKAHLLVALNNGSGVGEKLRITSDGYVAINGDTNNVPRHLWLYNGSNDPYFRIQRGTTSDINLGGIEFASSNGNGNNMIGTIYGRATGNSATTGVMIFKARDSSTGSSTLHEPLRALGKYSSGCRLMSQGNAVCVFGRHHETGGTDATSDAPTYNNVYEHSSSSYRTSGNGAFGGSFVVGGNASTWYPVWFSLPTHQEPQILSIHKYVHQYATWDGKLMFRASLSGSGYGAFQVQHRIHFFGYSYKQFVGKAIYTGHNNAYLVLWMLGGGRSYQWGTIGATGISVNVGDDGNTHNLGPGNSAEGPITSAVTIPVGYEKTMNTSGTHAQTGF